MIAAVQLIIYWVVMGVKLSIIVALGSITYIFTRLAQRAYSQIHNRILDRAVLCHML